MKQSVLSEQKLLEYLNKGSSNKITSEFSEYPIIQDTSFLFSMFAEATEDFNGEIGTCYTIDNRHTKCLELWEIMKAPNRVSIVQHSGRLIFRVRSDNLEEWVNATQSELDHWDDIPEQYKRLDYLIGVIPNSDATNEHLQSEALTYQRSYDVIQSENDSVKKLKELTDSEVKSFQKQNMEYLYKVFPELLSQ
jgi:hypothetical protein